MKNTPKSCNNAFNKHISISILHHVTCIAISEFLTREDEYFVYFDAFSFTAAFVMRKPQNCVRIE